MKPGEETTRVAVMPNEHLVAFLRSQGITVERCTQFTITWKGGTPVRLNVTMHQHEPKP